MHKVKKLAVLLAGDFRSWPRAAEYIFKFASNKAESVDYYFATWTTTRDYWYPQSKSITTQRTVTEQDVTDKFKELNITLIDFRLVQPLQEHYPSSFYYQSYLANIANILKRRYELDHNFIYDQVIEIRPDLFIVSDDDRVFNNFECLLDVVYESDPPDHKRQFPEAVDFYYQTNSFGSDIMTRRYFYHKLMEAEKISRNAYTHWPLPMHNHWIWADYLFARRLIAIQNLPSTRQIAIRSNFPPGDLTKYTDSELWAFQKIFLDKNRE